MKHRNYHHKNNRQNVIIADASGLISLLNQYDQNYAAAANAADRLRNAQKDILVPTAVRVELLNILGSKIPSIEIARAQQVSKKTGLRRSFPLIIQFGYMKEAKERTVEELEEMLKEAKKKRTYQTFVDEVDKKEEKDT